MNKQEFWKTLGATVMDLAECESCPAYHWSVEHGQDCYWETCAKALQDVYERLEREDNDDW